MTGSASGTGSSGGGTRVDERLDDAFFTRGRGGALTSEARPPERFTADHKQSVWDTGRRGESVAAREPDGFARLQTMRRCKWAHSSRETLTEGRHEVFTARVVYLCQEEPLRAPRRPSVRSKPAHPHPLRLDVNVETTGSVRLQNEVWRAPWGPREGNERPRGECARFP